MPNPFRKKAEVPNLPAPVQPSRKSLTAAAAILSDPRMGMAAWRARSGEDDWQRTAWNYYDSIGELNAAVRWVSNAVSMADMYAAEVDADTGLITEATENTMVQAVANSILGGPVKRSQLQQTITLNWLIAGEVFIVVRPTRSGVPDEWLVLSSTEVEERGGQFKYRDPITGGLVEVGRNDLILRIWSPHPRLQSHADSSVRSALPILREVERTSMNIMSRLDSRLSGAGVWLVPEEMDFPHGDDDPEDAQGFVDLLRRAAEASLRDPGRASSQVPIIVPAPAEMIQNGAFVHQTFATELTAEVTELRVNAIRRLAMALDIPAEIMTGMGESSHWNAWQIEETTYKIHVAPLLDKIADALTGAYLQPTLARMGVADPERYVLAFNTSEIISRPDRFEELNVLFDKGLITDDFLRSELGIPDDAIPSEEEELRRIAISMITQAPSLVEVVPGLAELIGFEGVVLVEGTDRAVTSQGQPAEIESSRTSGTPEQGDVDDSNGLVAAAELMVWDALSRAGGRLLTREHRGQHGDTAKHDLHTVIAAANPHSALEGSFQFVDAVAPTFGVRSEHLKAILTAYCTELITSQRPHDREELRRWLRP